MAEIVVLGFLRDLAGIKTHTVALKLTVRYVG